MKMPSRLSVSTPRQMPGAPNPYAQWVPVVAVTAAGFLLGAVVGHDPRWGILGFGALVGIYLVARFKREALYMAIGLVLFDGAIRKWIAPGAQELVYFAKDGIVVLLAALWLVRDEPESDKPVTAIPVFVAVAMSAAALYLALQIYNPRNPSLGLYLFGLRFYLVPLALLVVVPWILDSDDFEQMMKLVVMALIPITLLAVLQSAMPVDHPINRYIGWQSSSIAGFGDARDPRVRATGTFSYISGFEMYLQIAIVAIPWLFTLRERRSALMAAVLLSCGLVSIIATGSRSPFVLSIGALPIATYPLWRHRGPTWGLRVAIIGILGATILTTAFREPLGDYVDRAQRTGDVEHRVSGIWNKPIAALQIGGAFGWGPGTAHQSREFLLKKVGDWGPLPYKHESEPARIIAELGAVGGLVWYGFRVCLLLMLVSWYRRAQGRHSPETMAAITAPIAIALYTLPLEILVVPTMYYLWCFWVGGLRLLVDRAPDATTVSDGEGVSSVG